ncbi:hypothetical protein ACLTEW_18410 [Gordonia lacunae]|uniref:hypothetical protein n=1 Tax=Gordonia lacunae TaxID=417102 RepID=UPI0039E5A3B1
MEHRDKRFRVVDGVLKGAVISDATSEDIAEVRRLGLVLEEVELIRDDELEDGWWEVADRATPTCPYCKAGPKVYSVTARKGDMPLIDFDCSGCDFHYQR